MATPKWIEFGDQLGSIVGACTGLVSLGVALVALRRQGSSSRGGRGRPGLRLVVVLASLSLAASVATWVFGGWRPWGLVALSSGLGAVVSLIAVAVARGRAPMPLPEPVRALLSEQLGLAEQPRYDFGALAAPSTLLIHVERQATPADRRAAGGQVLTIAQMLARSRHAVVTGGPGVGKSTMVAHIVWEAGTWWLTARAWSRVRRAPYGAVIPVAVRARALVDADLPTALAESWRHIAEIGRETFTRPPAPRASWLVLVDSLDEVVDAASRAKVMRRLGACLDAYTARTRLVVATRPLSAEEFGDLDARGVQAFRLRPFDPADVDRFALRWFTVRSGGGLYDPREEASRFLARIRSAGLAPLMRVPLLCTMAALVYEADRDMRLPTSRTDLYAQFVALLRRGRAAAPPGHDPLADWLTGRVDDLLTAMAVARCRADPRRLIEVATDWVRGEAPGRLAAAPQASWISTVRGQLMAGGLCTLRGTDVEFVHHSIAEFLAADPELAAFDPADLLAPATRSLALFVLARSGRDAGAVVDQLLDGPDAAPAAAGLIVADGIAVAPALRRRTVSALLTALRTDDVNAPDCLAVLAALGTDDEIRADLESVATEPAEGGWVRATVADVLAGLGAAAGTAVLRELAENPPARQSAVGPWARVRLAARTGQHPARGDRPARTADADPGRTGPLGRRALEAMATDRHATPGDRLEAASALHRLREETGRRVLRELACGDDVPAETRRLAAVLLDGDGDQTGRDALRLLARHPGGNVAVPPQVRRQAASALMEAGDPAGVAALREMAEDRSLAKEERRTAQLALAENGDPVGLAILAEAERGVLGVFLPGGPRPAGTYAIPVLLSMLAEAVARQWSAEATARDLAAQPLRVRWSGRHSPGLALPTSAAEIVDAYQRLPNRQLFVLGSSGSGKTTVLLGMLLELIARRTPDDPVPVLLSLSGWDPSSADLLDWAARQLDGTYPVLTGRPSGHLRALELLKSHRILLLLDGFDELPPQVHREAVRDITVLTQTGLPLVLTSRPSVIRHLARSDAATLRQVPAAELKPLPAADIVEETTQALPAAARSRWEPVLTEIRQHPNGPAARALSVPLVVSLARNIYADPANDPVELLDPLRYPASETIESDLVARLIPAVYGRHRRAAAERRLSTLATLLNRQGTREFAWWRLPTTLDVAVLRLWTGVALGVSLVPALLIVFDATAAGLLFAFGSGQFLATIAIRNRTPVPPSRFLRARSFAEGVRHERVRALAFVTACAVPAGLISWQGEGELADLTTAALLYLPVMVWLRPWGQWLLARTLLAATGRLPWRLVTFLADAANRGVLRPVGPAYRFRHHRLQDQLTRPPR